MRPERLQLERDARPRALTLRERLSQRLILHGAESRLPAYSVAKGVWGGVDDASGTAGTMSVL